jgi:hypothetical protein
MTVKDVVADSLKKGTGKAFLLIRDNPDIDFSEIVFNACINALGYDPQCEGNRAEYREHPMLEMSNNTYCKL